MERTTLIIPHPATIELFVNRTWDFAHSFLWENWPFSQAEIALAKNSIGEYYKNIPSEKFAGKAGDYFTAYCRRILLTRDYLPGNPSRYLPHPCLWLHPLNPSGFTRTKKWYKKLIAERKIRRQARPPCTYSRRCPLTFYLTYQPIKNHKKETIMKTEDNPTGKTIAVKPYTIKELAGLYGINRKTMSKWLRLFEKEIGQKHGRYFLIPQVEIIFKKLGLPSEKDLETGNDVR